jgi:hypothetical protein
VTITIKQTKDDTKVSIEQSGVPAKEVITLKMCLFVNTILNLRWSPQERVGSDTTSTP